MHVHEIIEYERAWIEGLNRGDLSAADASFAPDCVIHITGAPAPLSLDGFKQMLPGFLVAFPDLRFTIDDQIVEGDRAAYRWRARGTHTGPLGPVPPTGTRVELEGVLFDRIADGRVAERWEQWDQPGMMQQMGLA